MLSASFIVFVVVVVTRAEDVVDEVTSEPEPEYREVFVVGLPDVITYADKEVNTATKRATMPFSGGMYGKRTVMPFSGGMYGKRASAMPFSGGMYGKRSGQNGNYKRTVMPFSGGMYGKRSAALPFSGGMYGKRSQRMALPGGFYGKRTVMPFSGGMYGKRSDRYIRSMPMSGGFYG